MTDTNPLSEKPSMCPGCQVMFASREAWELHRTNKVCSNNMESDPRYVMTNAGWALQ